MRYVHKLKWLVLAAGLVLLAWTATGRLAIEQRDRSDEPEWTSISLTTTRQLAGKTPSGSKRDRRDQRLHEDPWRQGVQAATFGWPNPIFHKIVWGWAVADVAPGKLSPDVFQRYHAGNLAAANVAVGKLLPAIYRAREVVAFESALCAVLLFFIALRMAGWIAGCSAYLLWLFHPLIRAWSHQARPDFGMLLLLLVSFWLAIAASKALAGRHGKWQLLGLALLLGCAAGLCVGTKLNGGLAAIFVALVIPMGGLLSSDGNQPGWGIRLGSASLAGITIIGLLFACFPYLWSNPTGHLREVLDFWSTHMAMQQDHLELAGGIATRTFGERLALASERIGGEQDPLRATLGLGGGLLWSLLGLIGLAVSARWRPLRLRGDDGGFRVAIALLWILVIGLGSVAWLPLNWDRYFFPMVACVVLLEAALIGILCRLPQAIRKARSVTESV